LSTTQTVTDVLRVTWVHLTKTAPEREAPLRITFDLALNCAGSLPEIAIYLASPFAVAVALSAAFCSAMDSRPARTRMVMEWHWKMSGSMSPRFVFRFRTGRVPSRYSRRAVATNVSSGSVRLKV
jgi:hypothetical protein